MNHALSTCRRPLWHSGLRCVGILSLLGIMGATAHADTPSPSAIAAKSAWLRVAMTEPSLISSGAGFNAAEFRIFKQTQMELIRSGFVLTAALRRPEVRKLNIEGQHQDPVGWLAQQIKVKSPENTEIVQISMTGKDPEQAVQLVNAVVDAYLAEFVDVNRNKQRQRLNELDRAYANAESKVRSKRNEVKQLAEQLGVSDNKSLSLKQQMILQGLGACQQQLTRVQIDLRQAKAALDQQKVMLSDLSEQDISAFEVENYAHNDPQTRQLAEQLARQRMRQGDSETKPRPDKNYIHKDRHRSDLQMIQQQYEDLLKSLREGIRNVKRADLDKERLKKELDVKALTDACRELSEEAEMKKMEAEKLSVSCIDLEMMQTEIDQLTKTLNGIADEREKLQVEIRAMPRVTLLQRAGTGPSKD
jgi:polysaccharide biosynthesis transport protein